MLDYFILNSFPRSGSVYFANLFKDFKPNLTLPDFAVMHIPYLINNNHMFTVSILRNPYECIASALCMQYDSRDGHVEDCLLYTSPSPRD